MGRRRLGGGRLFRQEPMREVQDELEFHIEQRMQEYLAAGMDAESARRAALERIGDFERVRGECTDLLVAERRSHSRRDWLSDVLQDVRFGARAAARAPLFSLMAVLTLALGIGANSAMFGVVKSVLLDALPYGDPDGLVRVRAHFEQAPNLGGPLSAGTVQDITERQRSFLALGASTSGRAQGVLQGADGAVTASIARVQPGFFRTLAVSPVLGRAFADDDAAGDTAHVVLLAHAFWQQQFGGDGEVVGRRIHLNDIPRTVIGVLPRNFVHPGEPADLYLPLNLHPVLRDAESARGSHFLELFARLRPGVDHEAVRADLASIGSALESEYPRENRGISLRAERLHTTMAGEARTPLLILMAGAGLVLLMACANLAAALASRAIMRRREFAVRSSLGAGRGRLVRQLLTESVLLAAAGGMAGLLLAHVALGALRAANLEALPEYATLSLDAVAVAFTFGLALLTGAAFGITPALTTGYVEPQVALRDETRGASETRGSSRLRGTLVAAQLALCLSLLAGAGLLVRNAWLLAAAPLGFDTDNALTFSVPLSGDRYGTTSQQNVFRDEMARRLAALPAVRAVTVTNFLPTRVYNSNGVAVLGGERAPDDPTPFTLTTGVSENYFAVMRIPLIAGRAFTPADNMDSPPVAIVSEAMARRFWPAGDAVGARIRIGPNPQAPPLEVIGIVADTRTSVAQAEAEPMLYMPLRQGWWGTTFIVRTHGDPLRLIADARREVAAYDPALPVAGITTLRAVIHDGLAPQRLPMLLISAFGALALLLACIGVYALFANMAVAREREFGVRMALGSSRADIARLVLRQGAFWILVGLLVGAAGMLGVSRALRSLVHGVAPFDPYAMAGAVAALVSAALIALAVPVLRATRADPLSIMR